MLSTADDHSKVSAISESMILPPPEIRSIVDKTAAFVSKSPTPALFEDKIRATEKANSRFAFLTSTDAYHAYYLSRLQAFRAGEVLEAKKDTEKADDGKSGADSLRDAEHDGPPVPPALDFIVENPPPMNAVDLDILRLTALFTARSGRRFTSELASRESRNYQFDFLRPSHSLFGYFNRLTEQYTNILIPSKERRVAIDRRSGAHKGEGVEKRLAGRREVLEDARVRSEWQAWEFSRRKEIKDAEEADRIAFAEIDWQDFVVASTVEFTEGDEAGLVDLPPPMGISEVENMTIAQKKMAAMIMEGREDEVDEDERARQKDVTSIFASLHEETFAEEGFQIEAKLEQERQRVVQIRTTDSNAPMRIRKDYIPKAKRAAQNEGPTLTTFGNQQVPVDEFADHLRIELLDPRWKEQKRQNEANRSASNLLPGGTDASASLKAVAAHRPDIFGVGGNENAIRQAESLAKSKAREAEGWDGHSATKESVTRRFQSGVNLDEQIEALHRAKGLTTLEDGQAPKIGPTVPVQSIPAEPSSFRSGATFSAAPQPTSALPHSGPSENSNTVSVGKVSWSAPSVSGNSADAATPVGLPQRPVIGNPGDSFPLVPGKVEVSFSGEEISLHRAAGDQPDDEPQAKRQKVPDRPDGSYWPEEDWIASHPDPININIQLPEYAEKPAWGCNGSQIVLTDVPLTLLVATVRDRICAKVGLPVGKQRLTWKGKILANSATLAGLNFGDGESIQVAIKDVKRK